MTCPHDITDREFFWPGFWIGFWSGWVIVTAIIWTAYALS